MKKAIYYTLLSTALITSYGLASEPKDEGVGQPRRPVAAEKMRMEQQKKGIQELKARISEAKEIAERQDRFAKSSASEALLRHMKLAIEAKERANKDYKLLMEMEGKVPAAGLQAKDYPFPDVERGIDQLNLDLTKYKQIAGRQTMFKNEKLAKVAKEKANETYKSLMEKQGKAFEAKDYPYPEMIK